MFVYSTARDSLMEQLKNRLSSSAALISREIDANTLRDIRFERDITKPDYIEALQMLRQMRRSNDDIAFLYVMRKDEDGNVVFVVDSDESEDQALPGHVYESATEELMLGFVERSADQDLVTDAWGTFYSGYAPVINGHGEFLVGIDMRADEVRNKLVSVHRAALAGFLAAVGLSWLIATWMSRHFKKPIDAMVAQIQAIAAGDLDRKLDMQRHDEMDSLLNAINDMTSDLKKAREDNLRLAESLDDAFVDDKSPLQ
ncbi:hypothetical protein VDG1235_2702 [Verrucomicrobiia bacterium DG1235]|nr:hypothetical protein VDG1235_2702 [Verrucomicrobiae bacterium DG1235]